jgi:hypothetical protein
MYQILVIQIELLVLLDLLLEVLKDILVVLIQVFILEMLKLDFLGLAVVLAAPSAAAAVAESLHLDCQLNMELLVH